MTERGVVSLTELPQPLRITSDRIDSSNPQTKICVVQKSQSLKTLYTAQCTMCCLGSTIALYPKTEIQKPLSHGKKLFLRLFFLCSFRMKTLKLVSLFIFRHWKHYFWSCTQNREKIRKSQFFFMFVSQAGTNI